MLCRVYVLCRVRGTVRSRVCNITIVPLARCPTARPDRLVCTASIGAAGSSRLERLGHDLLGVGRARLLEDALELRAHQPLPRLVVPLP